MSLHLYVYEYLNKSFSLRCNKEGIIYISFCREPITGKSLYYANVGSYNNTHLLRIHSNFKLDWSSNCDPVGACDECPALGKQSTRYTQMKV